MSPIQRVELLDAVGDKDPFSVGPRRILSALARLHNLSDGPMMDVMATSVFLLSAMVLIGLSLSSLAIVFLAVAGISLRTVTGAAHRAKRRRDGFGMLDESFSATALTRLDETLERIWLQEQYRRPASR